MNGYENYSQQDFLDAAAGFNNPGAAQPLKSDVKVATSISWSDADKGTVTGNSSQGAVTGNNSQGAVTGNNSQGAVTGQGVPDDTTIANTSGEQVEQEVVAAGGDQELASAFKKVVGPAKGVESYLASLDRQIDEQKNKRKKARLLAFGLALLGGESMATALQMANQTPFFDEEELDQMLSQRKDLMDGMHTEYLASQGIWTPAVQAMQEGKMSVAAATAKLTGTKSPWDTSKLTAEQAKSFALANEAVTGNAYLTQMENNLGKDFDPGSISAQFETALVRNSDGEITGLNQAVLQKMNPEQAEYIQATMMFITAKLRKESGAAISATEWSSEFSKVVPNTRSEFKAAQEYRSRGLQSLSVSAGAPDVTSFITAAGFEEGWDGSGWFNDRFGNVNKVPTPNGGVVDLDDLLKQ